MSNLGGYFVMTKLLEFFLYISFNIYGKR